MAKKNIPQRSKDQTIVGFSCPVELKAAIKQAAAADNRNLSNWIVCQLREAIKAYEFPQTPAKRVAENKSKYGKDR